jgi:hypothetical protein
MTTADIRFGRYKNGLPYAAHIVLDVESPSPAPGTNFSCSGRGFTSQGYIEEVPATGYEDWKGGAEAGVSFALSAAGRSDCRVNVSKIEGLTTDTNPTIVAYAAALAVWKALGFEPAKELVERLEELVFSSWKRPHDELPKFG